MMYTEEIKGVLNAQHKTQPTLIQERVYDSIKNGDNVIAYARTGTGKTLAYALPLLETIESGVANQAVILAPTTELAVQIRHVLNPFLAAMGLNGATLVGAGNRKRQEERLKKDHPEVLVATPGRLLDFYSAGRVKPRQIKSMVLDEADDMLEFAKLDLLASLGQQLSAEAQICLFGATESEITEKAEEIFDRPFFLIDVRKEQKLPLAHYFLQVDNRHKVDAVQRLVKLQHFKGIMFFDSEKALVRFAGILGHTKTKFGLLTNGFGKEKRAQSLQDLRTGRSKLLLATDVAARGLDIPGLTYVINFDRPNDEVTYTHRAGRVGRMNSEGFVVTLGDDHDLRDLKKELSVELVRVYFASGKLSTKMPEKKTIAKSNPAKAPAKAKKKHGKRKNKNKGYHPHYLKGKK